MSASLLNYCARIKQEFQEDNGQRKWLLVDVMVCVALAVCLLGAFLVASVVVMAYVMAVGIMGVVSIHALCWCVLVGKESSHGCAHDIGHT